MIRHNILDNQAAAQDFVVAVRELKDPNRWPWRADLNLSVYDFFVFWHHRAMMMFTPPGQPYRNAAHTGPSFLPWHRYFLLMFERFLRRAGGNEDFRLPYWDWAGDAELSQPINSPLWSDQLLGQFMMQGWRLRLDSNPPGRNPFIVDPPRQLRRRVGQVGEIPRRAEVRTLVQGEAFYDQWPYDQFAGGFRNLLEGYQGAGGPPPYLHNVIHLWVGGDMTSATSPNDPVFFLHHCNVDRIWSAWQQRHPSQYSPQQNAPDEYRFHRIDDALHTFFPGPDVTPRMMLDPSGWYQYDTVDDLL